MDKVKILLVEDEEFNRELYADAFSEIGMEVVQARNGSEGVDKAQSEMPDIILMDINMPVMDGVSALDRIKSDKEKFGDPVIIMLTSLSSDSTITDSFASKANGFLVKHEFLPEEIVKEVKGIYDEVKGK